MNPLATFLHKISVLKAHYPPSDRHLHQRFLILALCHTSKNRVNRKVIDFPINRHIWLCFDKVKRNHTFRYCNLVSIIQVECTIVLLISLCGRIFIKESDYNKFSRP